MPRAASVGQHGVVKVQRRCGRGHGAGGAGKYGLVALAVLGGVGVVVGVLMALDVGRQRQVAVALHQLPGALAGRAVQCKAEQRAVFVRPAAQQAWRQSRPLAPAGHVHGAAALGLLADLHVGHHLVDLAAGEHTFDQQFELAAAGLLAKDARLDDAGVVEDQQVARAQQAGQFAKDAVHRGQARPSSRREALRSGRGAGQCSSGGSEKSKSLRVKARGAAAGQ
jgi:hypothetical protein